MGAVEGEEEAVTMMAGKKARDLQRGG